MNIFELFNTFETELQAVEYLEKKRWGETPRCTYCESEKVCVHRDRKVRRWQCWNCSKSFSITVGTIFHRTHLPLKTWYFLIAMMMNAKKSLSSHQLARDMGIRQPTVWSMMQRIRTAMQNNPEQQQLFKGIVEMDETYIGGKPRKENKKEDRGDGKRGRGTKKLPVAGIAERKKGGGVAAEPFDGKSLSNKNFKEMLKKHVDIAKSILMTDQYAAYRGMKNFIFSLRR